MLAPVAPEVEPVITIEEFLFRMATEGLIISIRPDSSDFFPTELFPDALQRLDQTLGLREIIMYSPFTQKRFKIENIPSYESETGNWVIVDDVLAEKYTECTPYTLMPINRLADQLPRIANYLSNGMDLCCQKGLWNSLSEKRFLDPLLIFSLFTKMESVPREILWMIVGKLIVSEKWNVLLDWYFF